MNIEDLVDLRAHKYFDEGFMWNMIIRLILLRIVRIIYHLYNVLHKKTTRDCMKRNVHMYHIAEMNTLPEMCENPYELHRSSKVNTLPLCLLRLMDVMSCFQRAFVSLTSGERKCRGIICVTHARKLLEANNRYGDRFSVPFYRNIWPLHLKVPQGFFKNSVNAVRIIQSTAGN